MTDGVPRVLHVLEAVRGGTSRHLADVVRTAVGVEHHVVIPPPDLDAAASGAIVDVTSVDAMAACGAVIHRLDMRRSVTHPANPMAAARLARLIRRVRPDVVHGHSSVGGALARLAGAGSGVPVAYTPNGLAAGRSAVLIERLLGRATAAFVVVSDSEADLVRRLRLLPGERIRVIPNGIDLRPDPPDEMPDLRAGMGLPPGTPLIGTVMRLVDQKAPVDFVAVCAAVLDGRPDAHGVLIGMGPLQPEVDRAVARAGIGGHFHQIQLLPRADAVLDQLDVFVLPSRFEGGPYTPLEAMRAGVPVVLSDVVGNRDAIDNGISGVLRPFGDIDGLAGAVVELMQRDHRRAAMVDAARRRFEEHFDVAVMGARLSALYRSLVIGGT